MLFKRDDMVYIVNGPLNNITYDINEQCFYYFKIFKVTTNSITFFFDSCVFEINNNAIKVQYESFDTDIFKHSCYQLPSGILKMCNDNYYVQHDILGEIIINTDSIYLNDLNIIITMGSIKRSYINNKLNPNYVHICDENVKYYSEVFLNEKGFIHFIQTLDNYPLVCNELSKLWCVYYIKNEIHLVYYNKIPKIQYTIQDFLNLPDKMSDNRILEKFKSNYLYFTIDNMKIDSNLNYLKRKITYYPNKYYQYGKVQFREFHQLISYLFNSL